MTNRVALLLLALLLVSLVAPVQASDPSGPAAAAGAEPVQDNQQFRQAVVDAYKLLDQEQWERAELAFIELTKKWPDVGEAQYHLACCYSRWSKSLEASERDDKLALAGKHLWAAARAARPYDDLSTMTNDPDMEPLRDSEDYRGALLLIRRRMAGPQAVADAQPLPYKVYSPRRTPDPVPLLLWCHETGGSGDTALETVTAVARPRNWVLVAVSGPETLRKVEDRNAYGWAPWAELRVLRTLHDILRDANLGPNIDKRRVFIGGYRQGAHVALSAAMVEPQSIHTALLVDSPLDARTFPLERIKAIAGKVRVYDLHTRTDTLGLPGARDGFKRLASAGVTCKLYETDSGPDLMPYLSNWMMRDFDAWLKSVE